MANHPNRKQKIHTISGHNFHGRYSVSVRGPAEGFILSKSQLDRIGQEMCGFSDCKCGGGYGDGPDSDSATTEQVDYDKVRLIPAAS